MSEGALVALVSAVAALVGSGVTWVATRYGRMAALERRVDLLEARNAVLWRYARDLVDHIYTAKGPPPPPWPDELLEAKT